jgi:hypothetical protein
MRQRLYDGDHPDVAYSLSNLGFDLRTLGQLERARELDEQALAMRQRLAEEEATESYPSRGADHGALQVKGDLWDG